MARYIDADKLTEYITTNYCKNCDIYDGEKCLACGMNDALNFIETFETADVAPKNEVAREIFAELEKLFCNVMAVDGLQAVRFNPADYADFKKKYTNN